MKKKSSELCLRIDVATAGETKAVVFIHYFNDEI
jgi:hypothetical protein